MAEVGLVDPVKRFVAILWSGGESLAAAVEQLSGRYGAADFIGPDRPFDTTDYYLAEMGDKLQRRIVSFEQLTSPESLAEDKLFCNAVEDLSKRGGRRSVNLDVGYVDHNKIVLGSVKYAGQKIYLTRGVYADLAGRYRQGRYQPFEWTFPDFRDGRYDEEFGLIRTRYLKQLRALRRGGGGMNQHS